ncbi:MAG TPA: TraR/DksA C4-type zinc finger protein [Vicinamibacteria bacterium]|nr:TraR/DksA C4-type zinc finger protein [Vicinamibacteria bacterium]
MVDLGLSRKRLLEELDRVNKRVAALKLEPEPEELASGGDNTPLSEEVDSALVAEEQELHDRILSGFLDRATALRQALRRVETGSYGFCLGCRRPIPESRLGLLPEVSLCAPCQAKREDEAVGRRGIDSRVLHWQKVKDFYENKRDYEG